MEEVSWQEVETIVDHALGLPEEERASFVEDRCAGNKKLKGEVTLLLESIFASEGWLEDADHLKQDLFEDIADAATINPEKDPLLGASVGSFQIRERIGEGGMGVVYRAERPEADIDHQVAIKVIRHGQATKENIRRFRREQRILAGLHHSGIAWLYDIGLTSDGLPYLIMEYVEGVPIDTYCRRHHCSVKEKMELFKQVLECISYAHENMVIHRDLKPGNILVDQNGQIKILDFGISKLLADEAGRTITQTGERLFTPGYAAPEQINQKNVSTATDLYSLGTILYKLLTDSGPFNFDECTRHEMEKTILETSPPPPSSRVNKPALKQQLKGDLDAIILKALRKDSARRYRTANEFLDDLSNYQLGLPVNAVKGSRSYRIKKFYRRHRQGVIAACTTILLIVGLAGFFAYRITQERNQARLEAKKAQNVSEFLIDLFESNYPKQSSREEVTARDLLQKGRDNASAITNDLLRADMLSVIGRAYSKLGYKDSALTVLKQSFNTTKKVSGINSLAYADANYDIAQLYALRAYSDLALPYFRKAYKIRRDRLPKHDLEISQALLQIGQSYIRLQQLDSAKYYIKKTIQKLNHSSQKHTEEMLIAQEKLGQLYQTQKKYVQAEKMYNQLFSSPNINMIDSLSIGAWEQNFAWVYIPQKKFKEALPHLQKSLRITESTLGKGHESSLKARNDLAGVYSDMGNMKKYKQLVNLNIMYTKQRYGFAHKMTCQVLSATGLQLTFKGELDVGEKYLRDALKSCRQIYGDHHYFTAAQQAMLAANLDFSGKIDSSDAYFRQSYDVLKKNKADFNRIDRRRLSFIVRLYKALQPSDTLRIKQFTKLMHPEK